MSERARVVWPSLDVGTHGGCSDVMLKLTSSARHDHRLCCTLTKAELLVQLEKSYILTAHAQ